MLSNGTVVLASSQTFYQDDAQSTATGEPTLHTLECIGRHKHCPGTRQLLAGLQLASAQAKSQSPAPVSPCVSQYAPG